MVWPTELEHEHVVSSVDFVGEATIQLCLKNIIFSIKKKQKHN